MPVTSDSAGPVASTASANGSTRALGTEMSTERPSMLESAVDAVPDPMLASSRRASSWTSEYWVLKGSSRSGGGGKGGDGDGRGRDGVAVDDQGDAAVREHGRARQRGAVAELGRERTRDQLALADEPRHGEREPPGCGADDHRVLATRGVCAG